MNNQATIVKSIKKAIGENSSPNTACFLREGLEIIAIHINSNKKERNNEPATTNLDGLTKTLNHGNILNITEIKPRVKTKEVKYGLAIEEKYLEDDFLYFAEISDVKPETKRKIPSDTKSLYVK